MMDNTALVEGYRRHRELSDSIDSATDDVTASLIRKQTEAYLSLLETPATCAKDCALKLAAMARHFEGGYAPAGDIKRVAGELDACCCRTGGEVG